jgi:hypothetical protein
LEVAHDFDVTTELGMHHHLNESRRRYLHFLEVKLTLRKK